MERWSAHQLYTHAEPKLGSGTALCLKQYAEGLKTKGLPVIFSLLHLAHITGADPDFLKKSVERRRETANYRFFFIKKRSGGKRPIHSPTQELLEIQQFIHKFILSKRPVHPKAYAFYTSGGILACANQHLGARWLIQVDLKDFFFSINEYQVYALFKEFGYSLPLSFQLARLCTTTRLPDNKKHYLGNFIPVAPGHKFRNTRAGVLPQGAPTSPMLSNLVAQPLDDALTRFAAINGMTYTRYADDLTFSAAELPAKVSLSSLRSGIIHIIRQNHFRENPKKIRLAGPGAKKIVLGLLVDGVRVRMSKEMQGRIDGKLHAISRYGLASAADFFGFASAFGFYNHVAGLIAFAHYADPTRATKFRNRFRDVPLPNL